ncbi:MAG: hypothetical protein AB2L24_34195 [Mangrovibacterium sp.]
MTNMKVPGISGFMIGFFIHAIVFAQDSARFGANTAVKYNPSSETRLINRPGDLWQYFQYGMVDFFATPIEIEDLFLPEQDPDKWLVEGHPVDNPYKKSDAPALRLPGESQFMLGKPLPMDMKSVQGKKIRIYIWEKGINVGRNESLNSWGDPPDIYMYIKNTENKIISSESFHLGSQGTFPWHCFYEDLYIPEGADGIYLEFRNRYGESVLFSNISYEFVSVWNTLDSLNDKQDPVTGSLARNPYYDDYNFSLIYGRASRYKWNFWKGVNGGLLGKQYDISTRDRLKKYFFEKVQQDADHMNHGIMYLASHYNWGKKYNLLPEGVDGNWIKSFADMVIRSQDKKTGYWGSKGFPISMGMTFHLASGLFNSGTDHEDSPDFESIHHMGIRIPRPRKIIKTTLAMQSGYIDENGLECKAGWPHHAYNFTNNPNEKDQRCALIVTANALYLMNIVKKYTGPKLRKEVYASTKAAVYYVLKRCVLNNGLHRQSDTDKHITSGKNFIGWILNYSDYLERKIVEELPPPEVIASIQDDHIVIKGQQRIIGQNSIRVYKAPKGLNSCEVNESNLIGIILCKEGRNIEEMDPILAARKIIQASKDHWGLDYSRMDYLNWKINILTPQELIVANTPDNLKLEKADVRNDVLYVSSVNWYGEESKLIKLSY